MPNEDFTTEPASVPPCVSLDPAPPLTNRGAQKTNEQYRVVVVGGEPKLVPATNGVSIDWFQGTISEDHLSWVKASLGGDWIRAERGGFGWPIHEFQGNIHVYYGDHGTAHLQITGSGLMELRMGEAFDEVSFACEWRAKGGSLSRFDIAMDDVEGSLEIDRIHDYLKTGKVATRFKSYDVLRKAKPGSSTYIGATINLGSRKSRSYMRIYDKALQQGVFPAVSHWVRCELECKDEVADGALDLLCVNRDIRDLVGIVAGLIEFKVSAVASNKHREEAASWWLDFLDSARKVALRLAKPAITIQKVIANIEKQFGPCLAAVMEDQHGDFAWFYEILENGRKRWKEKHRRLFSSEVVV